MPFMVMVIIHQLNMGSPLPDNTFTMTVSIMMNMIGLKPLVTKLSGTLEIFTQANKNRAAMPKPVNDFTKKRGAQNV